MLQSASCYGLYQTSIHPSSKNFFDNSTNTLWISALESDMWLPRTPQLLPAEVPYFHALGRLPFYIILKLSLSFHNLLQVDFATGIHLLDSQNFINLILDLALLRCCIASLNWNITSFTGFGISGSLSSDEESQLGFAVVCFCHFFSACRICSLLKSSIWFSKVSGSKLGIFPALLLKILPPITRSQPWYTTTSRTLIASKFLTISTTVFHCGIDSSHLSSSVWHQS